MVNWFNASGHGESTAREPPTHSSNVTDGQGLVVRAQGGDLVAFNARSSGLVNGGKRNGRRNLMIGTAVIKQRNKLALLTLGLVATALIASACSSGDGISSGDPVSGLNAGQLESLVRSASIAYLGGSSGTGIRVTGLGVSATDPDIANLSLGVEAFASTVSEARDTAALAMANVLEMLDTAGVDEDDITTQYFNIRPEYTYDQIVTYGGAASGSRGEPKPAVEPELLRDVAHSSITHTERRLIGYNVTNTITVKVRDLDKIGKIIDGAAVAGGDVIRINNVRFTIEDGSALEEEARTMAVADAVAKADLFANESGVDRGDLVFITESSFPQFPSPAVESRSFAQDGAASVGTQIKPGQLEIRITVQAVFDID
jgi:uncharacterized protein YggE